MNLQAISPICKLLWRGNRCCERSDWSRRQKGYEETVQKHGESVVNNFAMLGSGVCEKALSDLVLE